MLKFPELSFANKFLKFQVNVTLKKPGTKLEHHGIKIELIGEYFSLFQLGNAITQIS